MTEERLDRIQKHVYDALKTIQPEPFWTDFHDVIAEVRRLQTACDGFIEAGAGIDHDLFSSVCARQVIWESHGTV